MRGICYHVAVTLDGFIARPDGSTEGFPEDGDHVEDYTSALADYDTVIMGRNTYEFGYAFGLKPGERAYPHMEHWIFSKSIDVTPKDGVNVVRKYCLETIDELRAMEGSDIYLCGGSVLAGWLLSEGKIDRMILKLNPVTFGEGLPLFSGQTSHLEKFDLLSTKPYENGVILNEYARVQG